MQSTRARTNVLQRGVSSQGERDRDADGVSGTADGVGRDFSRIPPHATMSVPVQAKLRVSQPSDAHERQADRVAATVMGAGDAERAPGRSAIVPVHGSMSSLEANAALRGLRGAGHPLPASERQFFDPRFGANFSPVRIHTDSHADRAARAINARAFTLNNHVAFRSGEYTPNSTASRHLLAHELTHVIQQGASSSSLVLPRQFAATTIARSDEPQSVESDVARIEDLLSYGLFDWAITDADAIEALEILSNLPPSLQAAALRRINIGRLEENLPQTHRPILEGILTRVGRPPTTVSETVTQIQDLLSYGVFDWAITDSDAQEALRLLTSLPPAEQQRVVLVINYRRLYENLSDPADRARLESIRGPAEAHERTELANMEAHRERARRILDQIKTRADAMTLPAPSASGRFESFLSSEYLRPYCQNPSSDAASTAITEMTIEGAGGFSKYGYGLLRDMAERAGRRGIGYIDSPSFLGAPVPGSVAGGRFMDPWSQGPNPTDIMHFAAGIKWHWAPTALVQWYFIHYEKTTNEGWHLFGLDALNDVIAEEGGRLLAEDLSGAAAACGSGLIDLDPYFQRGRAFLRGELSESRLNRIAMRVHQPRMVVETGRGVHSAALWNATLMEQVMAGRSDGQILASPDARILTLLYHLLRVG